MRKVPSIHTQIHLHTRHLASRRPCGVVNFSRIGGAKRQIGVRNVIGFDKDVDGNGTWTAMSDVLATEGLSFCFLTLMTHSKTSKLK